MWNVNPKTMCRQHLLGEHVELHMFVGSLNKQISLDGYIRKGLVEIHNLRKRHEELVEEMIARGFRHHSPLPEFPEIKAGKVNKTESYMELQGRCDTCNNLYTLYKEKKNGI